MKINEISIVGVEQTSTVKEQHPDSMLTVSRSFKIGGSDREEAVSYDVTLSDDDVVEFVFADGTTWLSNAGTMEEIFPEAKTSTREGKMRVTIPSEITSETDERGFLKKVILKIVNILTKKAVQFGVEKLAKELEDKQLDGKIGLFRLKSDFQLLDYAQEGDEKPFCLFIHGTASSISGSFGDIRESDLMSFLQNQYGTRILAFQHRTLTENPLQNVKDLVRQLPRRCKLYLITTSRGGLVGEVLSRFCNSVGGEKGFTKAEREFLKKEYSAKYYESLTTVIADIGKELSTREVVVEKFVRIACPAGGTTLASKRLDSFFNITFNLIGLVTGLAATPVYVALKNLIAAIIDSKNEEEVLPGIEVQRPNSPFIKVINGLQIPDILQIDNSLVVISGNANIEFKFQALLIIASKLFFRRENDLVVDTVSMSLGTRRTGKIQEFFYDGKEINHFKYFENRTTNDAILQALAAKWGDTLPGFTTGSAKVLEVRDYDMSSSEIDNPLLRLTRKHIKKAFDLPPVKVSISQGDLAYASYPIMAGHFEGDSILYAEKQIDKNLEGLLLQFQKLGNYPGKIKESRVFITGKKGFHGAIILGLGQLEDLTPSELTKTVEMGVINYLFDFDSDNLPENIALNEDGTFGLSSLIIGCGYGGMVIENSIRAIIQGVYNANARIRELNPEDNRLVGHLQFVELFEDKASNSLFSIHRIQKDESNAFKIETEGKGIISLLGSKKRIPLDATTEWWNRITVEEKKEGIRELKFSTSTKSAREEEQSLFTSPSLMEETIEEVSTNNNWTPKRAKTIFEMLIPNDFKDELKRYGNIVWVLDSYSATYPWELLQDGVKDTKPICVASGMVRQLKSSDYRKTVKTVVKDSALVVADPNLDGFITQLKGALAEGKKVYQMLSDSGLAVTDSFSENHSDIVEKLYGDEYKIIHLSGHGVFHDDPSEGSGMVIGKNMYLSTREIQQMSAVPEFVFVNCCHLGKSDGEAEEYFQQRFKLAANIGTQLINNGVKCVIAAGWAVNDQAALEFAEVFYQRMIDGYAFGEAVKEARKSVYQKYSYTNTWGAYQAYGDPYYSFRKKESTNEQKSYLIADEAEIDLENLMNSLEIGSSTSDEYLKKLNVISEAVDVADIRNSKITELEALIAMELRDYELACDRFKELLNGKDSSFSFSSIEKYYNVKLKKIIEDYRGNKQKIKGYLDELDQITEDLKILMKINPTPERMNILGSTFKRKAFLTKQASVKQSTYENSACYYHDAYSRFNSWYSLTNWLTIEGVLILAEKRKWDSQIKTSEGEYRLLSLSDALKALKRVEEELPKDIETMNYWDMIKAINIKLCRYILNFSKFNSQKYLDNIIADISDLWKKAGSKGKRFAEIEHLEFVINVLSTEENKLTNSLSINLKGMMKKL